MMREVADTLSGMDDPSRFENFLVSPLGIAVALAISAVGALLLGWLF